MCFKISSIKIIGETKIQLNTFQEFNETNRTTIGKLVEPH